MLLNMILFHGVFGYAEVLNRLEQTTQILRQINGGEGKPGLLQQYLQKCGPQSGKIAGSLLHALTGEDNWLRASIDSTAGISIFLEKANERFSTMNQIIQGLSNPSRGPLGSAAQSPGSSTSTVRIPTMPPGTSIAGSTARDRVDGSHLPRGGSTQAVSKFTHSSGTYVDTPLRGESHGDSICRRSRMGGLSHISSSDSPVVMDFSDMKISPWDMPDTTRDLKVVLIPGGLDSAVEVTKQCLKKLRNLENFSLSSPIARQAIDIVEKLPLTVSDIELSMDDFKEGDLTALSNALKRLINLKRVDLNFNFKELYEQKVREKIKPALPQKAELVIHNTKSDYTWN